MSYQEYIRLLEEFILRNCDPMEATPEDCLLWHAIHNQHYEIIGLSTTQANEYLEKNETA